MSKSEALRLARELEACPTISYKTHAAELRRLHEANEAFGQRQEWWNEKMFTLEQQRDALRAELKEATEAINDPAVNNLRTLPESIRVLCAQRDALLETLKSTGLFLHHCWCDVQMNDHSFEKLNRQMEIVDAAIKAVEGEKA